MLVNCSSQLNPIERATAEVYENCNKADSCYFNLKEFTDFEWDTVYFIEAVGNLEAINQIIGCYYDGYREGTEPIIFKKGGKIIHFENNTYEIESNKNGSISVSDSSYEKSYVYTPETAFFRVEKVIVSEGKFYILHHVIP
jgi:hypothetical protein